MFIYKYLTVDARTPDLQRPLELSFGAISRGFTTLLDFTLTSIYKREGKEKVCSPGRDK